MSDYTPGVSTPPPGQGEPSPQPQGTGEGTQPSYVTQDALNQALQKIEATIQRAVQSQTDRTVGGLRKSVEKKLTEFRELATAAGMPAEVLQAEESRVWAEAIDEFRAELSNKPVPVQEQIDVTAVNNWILETADSLNVAPLYPGDPEFSAVNFSDPDPARFKQQYESAIKAKAQRKYGQTAAQPQAPQQPEPGAAGLRAPALGAGVPISNPTLGDLTARLKSLQAKTTRTPADYAEMRDLTERIKAQIPRK